MCQSRRRRRKRYRGKTPRRFDQNYKEHAGNAVTIAKVLEEYADEPNAAQSARRSQENVLQPRTRCRTLPGKIAT
jgi:hypothetical protein